MDSEFDIGPGTLRWTAAVEDEAMRIARFLGDLGIMLRWVDSAHDGRFLEGVSISRGCVITADRATALRIGDVLHEAGHLAVVPSPFRDDVEGDADDIHSVMQEWLSAHPHSLSSWPEDPIARGIMQAGECEAIAWSHAAALACGIIPEVRFRYAAPAEAILAPTRRRISLRQQRLAAVEVHGQLRASAHFGINGLRAAGFCHLGMSTPKDASPYPAMLRWLAH